MPMGRIQREASTFLNRPENQGRWFDTRAIAQVVFQNEWPEPKQMVLVRQALNALEKRGDVVRFGRMAEWRTAKKPEREPPRIVREVEKEHGAEMARMLREFEPEIRKRLGGLP